MTDFLDHIDRSAFLFLNGFHNPFFDRLMFTATNGFHWVPVYLFFLFFVIRKYKWKTLAILLIATIMIILSDQMASIVKEGVQRLRPSQQPGLPVHIVEAYKGGMYGFYSGHASNTSCVAVFLVIILGWRFWYVLIPAILWSVTMSYTRIYLGVHYPGDILAGWAVGITAGALFGKLSLLLIRMLSGSIGKTQ